MTMPSMEKAYREFIEGTSILNVGKSSLELLELNVNLGLCFLSLGNLSKTQMRQLKPHQWPAFESQLLNIKTYSLRLKCFNGLDLCVHIISHGLEVLQKLLGLINNGLVFKDGTIVGKIDIGGLAGILSIETLSVTMAFPEGLQRRDGFCENVDFFVCTLFLEAGMFYPPFPRPREE